MSHNPLVSIIIPTYQHAHTISECLDSIFSQTYKNIEVIVVDDGSTDNTQKVLKKYQDQIHSIYQNNAGSNPSRNRGAREAKGEYLLFCDADVLMQPMMLKTMVEALESHPEASYAYSSFIFGFKKFPAFPFNPEKLKKMNFIHTTSLLRKEDFPGFDESIKRFQDWDLWLTLLNHGKVGVQIPEVLYRIKTDNMRESISNWLPSIAYKIPWGLFGFIPKRIEKYENAKEIVMKKHGLV